MQSMTTQNVCADSSVKRASGDGNCINVNLSDLIADLRRLKKFLIFNPMPRLIFPFLFVVAVLSLYLLLTTRPDLSYKTLREEKTLYSGPSSVWKKLVSYPSFVDL